MQRKIVGILVITLLITNVLTIFGMGNVSADCPDGMIAYWKFDEGSGIVAYDSFDGNDGTIYGGAAYVNGISGKALEFDGSEDYISMGDVLDNVFIGTAAVFTVSSWIKPDSVTDYQRIVSKYEDTGSVCCGEHNRQWFISLHNQQLFLRAYENLDLPGNIVEYRTNDNVVSVGNWYYVVFIFDIGNDIFKIYVNGVEKAGSFPSQSTIIDIADGSAPLEIGAACTGKGHLFNGLIDEVAIYNRALSADEISSHYYAGLDGRGYCELVKEVTIDIKPGSYPNSINPISNGNVPVAVMTTDDFDASKVNPDTVVFLDATPCKKEKLEDVDNDGDIDMLFNFEIQELDFELLVDEGDEYPYAYLTGETIYEQSIEGKDTVKLVPPNQRLLETIFERLFERFPNLFPLLRLLLQR
jgi:hypothetical protein